MFAPPRFWESMTSTVQVKIMDTTPFKRFMFNLCMPIGRKVADLRFEKKPVPFHLKVLYQLAYWGLFRALRDRLGFTYIRSASTGGAALGPDVFGFFHAMGVRLKQIYGQTEISGISCIHRDDDIQSHTVGVPIPETEVRVSEQGEILSRSPIGVPRLLQERGGHRQDRGRRLAPLRRRRLPRRPTGSWWSSTGSRT